MIQSSYAERDGGRRAEGGGWQEEKWGLIAAIIDCIASKQNKNDLDGVWCLIWFQAWRNCGGGG